MYSTRFTVAGRGSFPTDMLRYDHCFPATGEDSHWIDRDGPGNREIRELMLTTRHQFKTQNYLTPARWASFGWRIIEIYPPVKY